MSRISGYKQSIVKFLKTKSFINDTTPTTKNILLELIDLSDHIPAIICLTIMHNQCKKKDTKAHIYYIASGIDMLMSVAEISDNRSYYDAKYGVTEIDNMIYEVICNFYKCITQNIETIRMSLKDPDELNSKIIQLCIDYSVKNIPIVMQKNSIESKDLMKKTDLLKLCIDYDNYKKKNRISKDLIMQNIKNKYGTVCKMAMTLGWTFGKCVEISNSKIKSLNDEKSIGKLEILAEQIGMILKIHDDFKNIERDIKYGKHCYNYVVNHGIKEAYMDLVEAKALFLEGTYNMGIDSKTLKEIIDTVIEKINIIVKDASVDMETQYDDVSVAY